MKKANLYKSPKLKKSKHKKDWGTHTPKSSHRILSRWESHGGPKDAPVQLSELESIQLADTIFYIRYSKVVPLLLDKEFKDLCQDIAEKGVLIPVIVDEYYVIIDGEHRVRAAQKVGLRQIPVQVRPALTENEKWKLAQDLNLHRRQLTQEQINQIIHENRDKLPQMALKLRQERNSLRQIGEKLGVSHQQAKKLIHEETAVNNFTAKLPEQIIGKDGKTHPTKKPSINVNTTKELQRAIDACQAVGSDNLPSKPLELKRVERIARESERKQLREQQVSDFKAGQIELLQGDFNIKGLQVPDNSVDVIFTDPPYVRESLPLWDDLGQLAARVLKPSGLLVSYSGNLFFNQILPMLDKHLTYLWTAAIYHSGAKKKIYPVGMNQAWKPILIYYKVPKNIYWPTITDMVSGGESKVNHPWEQSVIEAAHYIQAFCPKDGVLLDPMMGSGTSLIAGLQSGLGLRCIGIEIDKAAYSTVQARVNMAIAKLQNKKASA
ncbi:MAG: ParB N-terminal domain-containing protein [Planctomycetota bacterium]